MDPFRDRSACLDLGGAAMEIINRGTQCKHGMNYNCPCYANFHHREQDLKENDYASIVFIQGSLRF